MWKDRAILLLGLHSHKTQDKLQLIVSIECSQIVEQGSRVAVGRPSRGILKDALAKASSTLI